MDISNELTTLIEETDFESLMGDFDVLNYEFIICNNPGSFGIHQLKKKLLPKSN